MPVAATVTVTVQVLRLPIVSKSDPTVAVLIVANVLAVALVLAIALVQITGLVLLYQQTSKQNQ